MIEGLGLVGPTEVWGPRPLRSIVTLAGSMAFFGRLLPPLPVVLAIEVGDIARVGSGLEPRAILSGVSVEIYS